MNGAFSPAVWPSGPRILGGFGRLRLELLHATPYASGVVEIAYSVSGLV